MYVLNTKTRVHFIEHPEMQMSKGLQEDCVRVANLTEVRNMIAELEEVEAKKNKAEGKVEPVDPDADRKRDWTKLPKSVLIQHCFDYMDINLDKELTTKTLHNQVIAALAARESGEDEKAAMKACIFVLPEVAAKPKK